MFLKKIYSIILFGAMVLVLNSASYAAGSADLQSREYDIGLEAGLWFPGTVYVEDSDLDKDAGPLFRIFADTYVAPKFAVGVYGNYSTVSLSSGSTEVDATFWEIGMALKPKFMLSSDVALKPGLNIGYRKSSIDINNFDPADGMGLNLSVELQFALQGGYIFFIDGGFLSQPVGGNDKADVTWAPIIYLCGGIAF